MTHATGRAADRGEYRQAAEVTGQMKKPLKKLTSTLTIRAVKDLTVLAYCYGAMRKIRSFCMLGPPVHEEAYLPE